MDAERELQRQRRVKRRRERAVSEGRIKKGQTQLTIEASIAGEAAAAAVISASTDEDSDGSEAGEVREGVSSEREARVNSQHSQLFAACSHSHSHHRLAVPSGLVPLSRYLLVSPSQ